MIYADRDHPSLLFSIPRRVKREEIGLSELLPFHGVAADELSWMRVASPWWR
ncbi:hypothetical protein [Dyella koreensis]|uniref:hypothetical protein n=1 Tax=Dyella koreensis TaxID=311235 RepID=UPI00360B7102